MSNSHQTSSIQNRGAEINRSTRVEDNRSTLDQASQRSSSDGDDEDGLLHSVSAGIRRHPSTYEAEAEAVNTRDSCELNSQFRND